MIPEAVLQQIQDRADIVEIVSAHVPLKRAGRNFKANCPFHGEKSPSFMVSPDKQIFHCFGCGAGGNVFGFLMKIERKDFREVAEELAQRVGVDIPKDNTRSSESDKRRELFVKANSLAAEFYHKFLLTQRAAEKARDYVDKRGLSEATVEEFKLGWAPDSWDAFYNAAKGQVADGILEKAGLIMPRKDGSGFYDRFRTRVMFPILDSRGTCVAFGGRVLDDSQPKYLNSPETEIYYKGRELYGLFQARKTVRDKDAVLVVEGYMDVIACHQAGVKNVVASLGTALTQEQARLVKRHTHNVYILYDADKAGEMATLRGLEIFLEEDLEVKIVRLPEGHDPDSFIKQFGKEAFEKEVAKAKNLFEYKLALSKTKNDPRTLEGKIRVANDMATFLAKVKNEISRSAWVKELAQDLTLSEDAILAEIKKGQAAFKSWKPEVKAVEKEPVFAAISQLERLLIGLSLEHEDFSQRAREELRVEDFTPGAAQRVVERILNAPSHWSGQDLLRLFAEDPEVTRLVSASMAEIEAVQEDKFRAFDDCVLRIKKTRIKSRQAVLDAELKEAQSLGDYERTQKILREFNELNKGMRAINEKK